VSIPCPSIARGDLDGVALGVRLGVVDALGDTDGLGGLDGLGDAVALALGDADRVALGVTDALGVVDGVGDAVGLREAVAAGERDAVPVAGGDGVGVACGIARVPNVTERTTLWPGASATSCQLNASAESPSPNSVEFVCLHVAPGSSSVDPNHNVSTSVTPTASRIAPTNVVTPTPKMKPLNESFKVVNRTLR
jgi:hypothetical protein